MKNLGWKIFGGFILLIVIGFGLEIATGYMGVFKTRTVGKAQQNAEREVFEETQSYVEGKRQSALKWYREFQTAEERIEKKAVIEMVAQEFANFKEEKYLEDPVKTFVYKCKYSPDALIPKTIDFPLKE